MTPYKVVMDWFKNWFGSPFYKILYQNRDEAEAQDFVEKLLEYLKPAPGSTMVDIACGEGRYALQLADHGYDVTGIDLSHHAIETAKASETGHLHFFIQDMRMPFYVNYFDYAFNFFTSFGYFEHARDNALAARSFAGALKPGGVLVLDYFNSEFVTANLIAEQTVVRGSYTFKVSKRLERKHIIKEINFVDADSVQRHYCENVSAFTLNDFTDLFGKAGLTLEATFGNYKLDPFDAASSPRLIMIFRKKHV